MEKPFIVVGNYTITMTAPDQYEVTHRSGESMSVPESKLIPVIEKFFADNF